MSLLEINIEKPALVEERVYPNRDTAPASARTKSESSGRSAVSLVKPLVGLLIVAGIALLVGKRRTTSDESSAFETDDADSQSGRQSAASVVGVLGTILAVVALARKVRGGSADE
ncbi:hypothetical protein [Haladaptatus caseinilyticus]|uniref:hypothetical protein n=1 Tax=Haladaptatus caseinilyticus TaxID=2993314 RepID=UPI00224AFFEF|nr:hypothetical protein [Haladaptatus caseinilyticus]